MEKGNGMMITMEFFELDDGGAPGASVSRYEYGSAREFIEDWKVLSGHPDGMWYEVRVNDDLICSGACDPGDMEIFQEYFGLEMEGKVVPESKDLSVGALVEDASARAGGSKGESAREYVKD